MATTMPGKKIEIEVKADSQTFGETIEELAERIGKVKKATEAAVISVADGLSEMGVVYKGYGELEELGKIMAETKPKAIALGEAMKRKEMAAGMGVYAKGSTSLDPILEGEPLDLLQIVYYKEEGWSRSPLRVVEID